MTKKEFERHKRYCNSKLDENISGYFEIFISCPEIFNSVFSNRYYLVDFDSLGKDLINGNNFIIQDKCIHFKYIQVCYIWSMKYWIDRSGHRDRKLEYYLNNLR